MKSLYESIFNDDDIIKGTDESILKNIVSDWLGGDFETLAKKYNITIEGIDTISIGKVDFTPGVFAREPKAPIKINNCGYMQLPSKLYHNPEINHISVLDCRNTTLHVLNKTNIKSIDTLMVNIDTFEVELWNDISKKIKINTLCPYDSSAYIYSHSHLWNFDWYVDIKGVDNLLLDSVLACLPIKFGKISIDDIQNKSQLKTTYKNFYKKSKVKLFIWDIHSSIIASTKYEVVKSNNKIGIDIKPTKINFFEGL